MSSNAQRGLMVLSLMLFCSLSAPAQLRPDTTPPPPPKTTTAPKPAQIIVITIPAAEVYLDDQFVGHASAEGRLVIGSPTPGDHSLRVTLAGKKDFLQRVTVVGGQVARVEATLADLPGSIRIQTSAGAEVFLDNSRRGTADAAGRLVVSELAPGPHELRIAALGKKAFRQNVTVLVGEESRIEAPLVDLAPPTPGEVRENSEDGLKYVWIPAGTFMMGCSPGDNECYDDEKPSHQVTISKGFWIGQTPVTVGAYRRLAGATGRQMPPPPGFNEGESIPIVDVTWDDAQAYCSWAGGRLPTEAEWEYAARGGSTESRYGSIDGIAWYDQNSGGKAREVAQKRANGFGLYDMLGNVFEWVNDWYDQNYYQSSPSRDPRGPSGGQFRVLRGGSWDFNPRGVRVSNRDYDGPAYRSDSYGFRCGGEVF